MAGGGVRRLAQLYGRNALKFPDILDEVKAKGYTDVAFAPMEQKDCALGALGHTPEELDGIVDMAGERGLAVSIVALYQKQKQAYLAEHPDQVMRSITDDPDVHIDQDKVTMFWGCPFNPDFKDFYISLVRELITKPAVTELWFNSEGYLGSPDAIACYCPVCRADFQRDTGREMPREVDWDNPLWVQMIKWRFARWVAVHAEMRERLRKIRPDLTVSFLSSGAIDLWGFNPWGTGVDLASMGEVMDSLITNPYFTFHQGHGYSPIETYMTEWSRFMRAMVPEAKHVTVVAQGFNHPTFARPLIEKDGLWGAILPLAAGAARTASFEYTLQKATPMQAAYESMFALDELFSEAKPIKYAAVVHSFQSEVYGHPEMVQSPDSYDITYFRSTTEALRHNGVPYNILADRDLVLDPIPYSAIVLPEVTNLNDRQRDAILSYWRSGGGLVVTGALDPALCRELGIEMECGDRPTKEFFAVSEHPVMWNLDRGIGQFEDPEFIRLTLAKTVNVKLSDEFGVAAKFQALDGSQTDEAAVGVLDKPGRGRLVIVCGATARTYYDRRYFVSFPNHSHALIANAVTWAAREPSPLRLSGYPPLVANKLIRPHDARVYPTGEFFALAAPNYYLAVLSSYFEEKMDFTLEADAPSGRNITSVTELISDTSNDAVGSSVSIPVSFGFHDYLKVYRIGF